MPTFEITILDSNYNQKVYVLGDSNKKSWSMQFDELCQEYTPIKLCSLYRAKDKFVQDDTKWVCSEDFQDLLNRLGIEKRYNTYRFYESPKDFEIAEKIVNKYCSNSKSVPTL